MIVILIKRYNYFILKFCVAQQRRGIKQKRSGVEIELQIFVARGVVDPVFAHFYKKEEVNFAFKQFFQFPGGPFAPIFFIMLPPLPRTMTFWLSRST